jgi:hypothetical protein
VWHWEVGSFWWIVRLRTLRVCRQIYEEANPVLWRENRILLVSDFLRNGFVQGSMQIVQHIRTLAISLNYDVLSDKVVQVLAARQNLKTFRIKLWYRDGALKLEWKKEREATKQKFWQLTKIKACAMATVEYGDRYPYRPSRSSVQIDAFMETLALSMKRACVCAKRKTELTWHLRELEPFMRLSTISVEQQDIWAYKRMMLV